MRRALGLVLTVAAIGGCGGGEPGVRAIQADAALPTETLADWVSYGDQLSVVSVTGETPPRLPPDWKNSGGIVPRKVTMRIERTLWRRAGGPTVGGQIRFDTWGWMMESDQEADSPKHPLVNLGAPRLEVGERYLALIMRMRGEWFAVDGATLTLDGDVVTSEVVAGEPSEAATELKGKTIAQAAATVAGTEPHPGAVEHAKLPPVARFRAIQRD